MKDRKEYIGEFGYIFAPNKDQDVLANEIRRQVGQAMAFDPGTERVLSQAFSEHPCLLNNSPWLITGIGVGLELDFVPKGVSQIDGVDTNGRLLEVASERARRLGLADKFNPIVANATDLVEKIGHRRYGAISNRLFFQHNPSEVIPSMLENYRNMLLTTGDTSPSSPGQVNSFLYLMDLDGSTWQMKPSCDAFTTIMEAVDTLYQMGGRDRFIGKRLEGLLGEAGYEILIKDRYFIPDPTRELHLKTLEGMGRGVVAAGIMSPDDFHANFDAVRKATPQAEEIQNPEVYQYIATPC
jgi:hypothetical protein